ncbi:hypothetical protein Ahy_A02g009140 isoform A [Arachis hypogaea]|uniref:Uncharacterized protein n=1 Tax=Arachis hypogaea TaxID=3818 RepID=A0A445EFW5_ARAHY|nr:hypothetical protein Ahy_A02g009140 isoform A [Arachis hypogaea]
MRISRMLNAYTYPGCTQDVTRRHPSTARDLRRRDMAILELKNIVTSGTVGNRLGRALSSCRACLLNRARSQGCKSPTGFIEEGCSIVYVVSFGSSVVDFFTPNWAYTSSTMLQDFMEQSTAVIPLLCSPASCSSLMEPATCSALLRRIREQRAQNNKSLFNGNKFRDFCGNKLKSYVGKVFGSIRSTNHAVMGNEERLHVTWKEGHCQKLA